jgi:hypothetical protein
LRQAQTEYEPDLNVGDNLLVWAKSVNETRLEEDGTAVLPGKLVPMLIGPYEMVGRPGKRKVEVLKDGKVEQYNVNRVVRQIPWDEHHPDTSGLMQQRALVDMDYLQGEAAVGQIVIFGYTENQRHQSPFGVGRITEVVSSDDLRFQWLGNIPYSKNAKFEAGWYNSKGKYYYRNNKLAKSDTPMTSEGSGTVVGDKMLYGRGSDLLDSDGRLTLRAKQLLTKYADVKW